VKKLKNFKHYELAKANKSSNVKKNLGKGI